MIRNRKNQIVKVQELKSGQFVITLPMLIASEWLDVKKGDRLEFKPHKGIISISKIEVEK
jgi:hypothetical protein